MSASAADLPKALNGTNLYWPHTLHFLAADVSVIPPNQQTRFFWQRRHFSGVCSIPGIPSLNEIRRTSGNIIRTLSGVTDAQEHSCDYECNTPQPNHFLSNGLISRLAINKAAEHAKEVARADPRDGTQTEPWLV